MSASSSVPSLLQRMLGALVGFVVVVGGTLLMLAALLFGLLLAGGVVLWSLLRGRRPAPMNLHWGTMPRPPRFGRRTGEPAGEVVDVQAREVDGPTRR